jgi:broad specificity phosphatase PhoE
MAFLLQLQQAAALRAEHVATIGQQAAIIAEQAVRITALEEAATKQRTVAEEAAAAAKRRRTARVVKTVTFFRHGQGRHNLKGDDGVSQLHLFDPPLTAQGEGEARAIAHTLMRLGHGKGAGEAAGGKGGTGAGEGSGGGGPDVVFVSPLWRTLQTADLALSALEDMLAQREEEQQRREQQEEQGASGKAVRTGVSRTGIPLFALEDAREGNNNTRCNHRRPMGPEHTAAFPRLETSLLLGTNGVRKKGKAAVAAEAAEAAEAVVNGDEARSDIKDEIEVVRARAQRLLSFLRGRPERSIAVFSHQGLIRNVGAAVVGLGRDHSMTMPPTGSGFQICLVEEGGAENGTGDGTGDGEEDGEEDREGEGGGAVEGEGKTDAGDGVGGYDGGSDSGSGGSGGSGGANVAGGGRGGGGGRRNYHWQLGEETTMSVERIKSRRAPRRNPKKPGNSP